jgi:hypothetical protein
MKKMILTLALALLTVAASAQQKLDVSVKQVNDRRTSGSFSMLGLTLELPKVQSSEVAASRVFIATAVDETGRSLVHEEAGEPPFELNAQQFARGAATAAPSPAQISLNLKNPDRKATKVRAIAGEIELYMPGKDPNSIADIAKFTTMAGKTLSHKALKANGVEISVLSAAQVAAEKKKRAEAKKKEYAEMGYSGEDLENMLESFLETLLGVEENQYLVRIKDPNKRIQDINYIDPAGDVKLVSSSDEEGLTLLSTWAGTPQADWKMRVSMKTPKNVVRYAFALSDVPLP